MNINVGILKNKEPDSVDQWVKARQNKGINYKVIDLTRNTWLNENTGQQFDIFLLRPLA